MEQWSNCLVVVAIVLLLTTPRVFAATPDVGIRFRPHCSASQAPQNEVELAPRSPTRPAKPWRSGEGEVGCQEFPLYDPETLITHGVQAGDILDIDIVLTNPSRQPLQSVQSWVEYDPDVLKGVEVRIVDQFPLVAPGEQAFSSEKGLVKLGASNVAGGMQEPEAVFARVKFQVLSQSADPVLIRFHEFNLLGQEGRTKVLLIEEGRTVNVLKTRPKDLLLFFGEGVPPTLLPPSPSPQPSPAPQPGPSPTPSPIPTPLPDDGFSRLQPQNLRVMTGDDRVYLLWDPLTDSRVAGYNVYYGTVSGRYVQRRTVSRDVSGVTIRGLPLGKRYYFAVAAFDRSERESQFGYEVAVTVGDPESSTAPLSLSLGQGPPFGVEGFASDDAEDLSASLLREGQGRVPGETGMPLWVLSFFLIGGALVSSVLTFHLKRRSTLLIQHR